MRNTMRIIKIMTTLLTVLWIVNNVYAQSGNVKEDVARQVATNFLMLKDDNPKTNVQLTRVNAVQYPNLYVYNTSDNGFIVVSSDNRMEPILAYSDEGAFDKDNVAPGENLWLEMYENAISMIVKENPKDIDEQISQKWNNLYNGIMPEQQRDMIFPLVCQPLIQTNWEQGTNLGSADDSFWNDKSNRFCPWYEKDGKKYRAATGCVAVALGQFLNYKGIDVLGTIQVAFYHKKNEYDTLTTLNSSNQLIGSTEFVPCGTEPNKHFFHIGGWNYIEDENERAAKMMYDCGLAVETRYGINSSSAYDLDKGLDMCYNPSSAETALKKYFKYPNAYGLYKKDYTDVQWRDTLQKYISHGWPLMYGGNSTSGGHSFICDGYNANWNCFHFNFGDKHEGYYSISLPNLCSELEYSIDQDCLIAQPVMQHDVTNINDVIDFPESKTTTWYGNTIIVEYDDNPSIVEDQQAHTYTIKYNQPRKYILNPIIHNDKMLNYSVTVLPVEKDTLRESETICRRAGFHGIYGSGDDVVSIDLSHDETDFFGTQKFYRIINNNVTGDFSGVLELELTTSGVIAEHFLPAVTVNRCDLLPGNAYPWVIGGETYYLTHSGTFEKSFNTGANCDSVVYLPLTINEPEHWYYEDTLLCFDKCPISYHGLQINNAGEYLVCDNNSIYTLSVGLIDVIRPLININICQDEAPAKWNGYTFPWTEPGYYDTIISKNSECECDTIYDVHIVIFGDCCTPSLHCMEDDSFGGGYRDVPTNKEAIYYGLKHYYNYRDAINGFLTNVFPGVYWSNEERNTFWNNFQSLLDPNTGLMSEQNMQQLIATNECSTITEEYIVDLVERYNRSVMYWDEGYYSVWYLPQGYNPYNFIEYDTTAMNKAYDALEYAQSQGFGDVRAMYDNAYQILESEVENTQSSVCAHVTVKFTQKMTMTREAFNGTLQIFNGHESLPMQDIMVDFMIKDPNGNDCTNLFQINTLSLDQITGISGDGSLAAQTSGTALVQFIPTRNAAPTQPTIYYFGGSFSFIDPFTGEGLTYPLYPVDITVNPSPDLYVDYFMQRDILGDDALTEDKVEPSIPAELGVIINNKGAGMAKNVILETAEPQIIDNEKGLAIDFSMYGASFNGSPRQLGLMEIPFGDIESGHTAVGEWLFTSSLLGHFVSYEANVIHNSSYGNPDLSLVSHIDIHELIHPIYAYGSLDDGINDFLVNDEVDAYDQPDSIYFSNGGRTCVGIVNDISFNHLVTRLDTVVTLTVTPLRAGWNYGVCDDPGTDKFELYSCTRDFDGQEIPLQNIWQTFVRIPDGGDPIYENRLHIVDTLASADQSFDYTLVYTLKTSLLDVEEIIGIPESFIEEPLTSFQVKFNKAIIDTTFTYEDMTLKCQNGSNLMDESVVITKIADSLYNVDITGLTDETGYYVLNVNTLNIKDIRGYEGYNGKQASWVQSLINEMTHTEDLVAGWNWWSTYIEQFGVDGLLMLENSLGANGLSIQSQTSIVQNYYPQLGYNYWFGELQAIDNENSYMINLSDDCVAQMTGTRANTANHPITIVHDWNWIGYPVTMPQNVAAALGGLQPEPYDVVKNQGESSIYYENYGWFPLFNMTPGQGYLYMSNAEDDKTFVYNSNRTDDLAVTDDRYVWKSNRHEFANNLTVVAAIYLDDEMIGGENIELGAFAGDDYRGSARLEYFEPHDCYYAVLTVSGENGDRISFGIIDRNSYLANFDCNNELVFETNAVVGNPDSPYIIRFHADDHATAFAGIYPNPVDKDETFNLAIPDNEVVGELLITDILGNMVRRVKGNNRTASGISTPGVYDIKIVTKSGKTYHGRLIVK